MIQKPIRNRLVTGRNLYQPIEGDNASGAISLGAWNWELLWCLVIGDWNFRQRGPLHSPVPFRAPRFEEFAKSKTENPEGGVLSRTTNGQMAQKSRKKVLVKIFTIMQLSERFGRKRSWDGALGNSGAYLLKARAHVKTTQ